MSSNASSSCTMGVEMEVIIENMKDLAEEHAESRLPRREGYEWEFPRTQSRLGG
ncbi:hypothetical protein LR48_Vigan04g050300 [Vigna angularis]|uniref:Uncharacterized protein n=1 Tax=Phaseolus angularis TaxID=3914 RepID=A0A0L9UBJ0_PHAAN|nr:hypothetical protein LR48_Vigan04g050300 [Vigna angularis]